MKEDSQFFINSLDNFKHLKNQLIFQFSLREFIRLS